MMILFRFLSFSLLIMVNASCNVTPMTTDERLANKATDSKRHLRLYRESHPLRFGMATANAMRQQTKAAALSMPKKGIDVPDLFVEFTALDFAIGSLASKGMTAKPLDMGAMFLLGFQSSGASELIPAKARQDGMQAISRPSHHYYFFEEGDSIASEADVDTTFESTRAFFHQLYGNLNCKPGGSHTNARGVMIKAYLMCSPHPLYPDREVYFGIKSVANPFPGVKTLGAIEMFCGLYKEKQDRSIKKMQYHDTRACGEPHAALMRPRLPKNPNMMELVVTPNKNVPSKNIIQSRYQGRTLITDGPDFWPESFVTELDDDLYNAHVEHFKVPQ